MAVNKNIKCKFGYYNLVAKCDWKPSPNGGYCSEVCNPAEHRKLIKANKALMEFRQDLIHKLRFKSFVLHWWGCDYQRTSRQGWYRGSQYIGKNVFEAGKWLYNNNIAYIRW